jgi:hypothetical protein
MDRAESVCIITSILNDDCLYCVLKMLRRDAFGNVTLFGFARERAFRSVCKAFLELSNNDDPEYKFKFFGYGTHLIGYLRSSCNAVHVVYTQCSSSNPRRDGDNDGDEEDSDGGDGDDDDLLMDFEPEKMTWALSTADCVSAFAHKAIGRTSLYKRRPSSEFPVPTRTIVSIFAFAHATEDDFYLCAELVPVADKQKGQWVYTHEVFISNNFLDDESDESIWCCVPENSSNPKSVSDLAAFFGCFEAASDARRYRFKS